MTIARGIKTRPLTVTCQGAQHRLVVGDDGDLHILDHPDVTDVELYASARMAPGAIPCADALYAWRLLPTHGPRFFRNLPKGLEAAHDRYLEAQRARRGPSDDWRSTPATPMRRRGRKFARTVDPDQVIDTLTAALLNGDGRADGNCAWRVRGNYGVIACHGGGVANAYKWPAQTETFCAVARKFSDGTTRACWWTHGWVNARGVTSVAAAHPDVEDLFDGRVKRPEAIEGAWRRIAEIFKP